MSKINIYMGWTFEDVLTASKKINVKLTCDEAESIIKDLADYYKDSIGVCNWDAIYKAVRTYEVMRNERTT